MKYIKKPIPVEAVQLPSHHPTAREYIEWSKSAPFWIHDHDIWMTEEGLTIPTLEGNMLCGWGSYIIQGVAGEIYPCYKEVFENTYIPVEDSYDITLGKEKQ